MTKKRALLSAFDKTGVVELARDLVDLDFDLVSSGGTAKAIAEAGIPVVDTAEMTGLPAILDHRVVTLHPKVHGGILADPYNSDHQKDMAEHGIKPFDLVVVNLYPFAATVASGASFQECIEKIDVGGPTMVRGAAKNFAHVGVVTDPSDYGKVVDELRLNGSLSDETRKALAIKAFAHVAKYDLDIVEWISDEEYIGTLGQKVADCDYGENRWQSPAALYKLVDNDDPLAVHNTQVVAGRSPSFINWTDADRLQQTMTHLAEGHRINFGKIPFIAIAVKHGNACGVGVADTPSEALKLMLTSDTRAVFGAVTMMNFSIAEDDAELLMHHATSVRRLLDGIIAPSFYDGAIGKLGRRDGKFFLGTNEVLRSDYTASLDEDQLIRPVRGGFLVEPNYTHVVNLDDTHVQGELSNQQAKDLVTAIAICATSNSNTVSAVKNGQLVANGVGQQDRVGCCELLVSKAAQNGHDMTGASAASDSFFPFPDGPEVLINAGVGTIFSTTGSNRDAETQVLCAERGVTLVQLPDADARMFYRH